MSSTSAGHSPLIKSMSATKDSDSHRVALEEELRHLKHENAILRAERDSALQEVARVKAAFKEVREGLEVLSQRRKKRKLSKIQEKEPQQQAGVDVAPVGAMARPLSTPIQLQSTTASRNVTVASEEISREASKSAKLSSSEKGKNSKEPNRTELKADTKTTTPDQSTSTNAPVKVGNSKQDSYPKRLVPRPQKEKKYPALRPIVVGRELHNTHDPAAFGERRGNTSGYQYEEVVRDKAKRKEMHGSDCFCCAGFYRSKRESLMRYYKGDEAKVDAEMREYMQKTSKHRTYNPPSKELDYDLRTIGIPGDTQFLLGD